MIQMRRLPSQRNKNTRALGLFLVGAGLAVLGLMALILLYQPEANSPVSEDVTGIVPVTVSFAAPDLNLEDFNGDSVSLADFRGQFVLLNNWATWCPPCKAEMPTLQAYYNDHKDQGFVILAIEAGEPVVEVANFAEEYGLTFPVLPDPRQLSLQAFRNLTLPNSYLIDRMGKVRLAWTGPISRVTLEKYITPFLEE